MTASLTKGSGLKGPDLRKEGSALAKSVWRGKLGELRNSFLAQKSGFSQIMPKKQSTSTGTLTISKKAATKRPRGAKAATQAKK